MSDAEDFFLLQPEDEWVEERLSRRRSWDDRKEFEQQSHTPTSGPSTDVWWYLWTGVALVLWTAFCVWAAFDSVVGGAGAAMLIWLRWRDR
jgi:hypothetical protein